MTDIAMRPATQPTEVTPLPSSIDIDAEISTREAHLAQLLAACVHANGCRGDGDPVEQFVERQVRS